MPTAPGPRASPARSRSTRSSRASARAGAPRRRGRGAAILAVSHYGFLHFFLGYTLFGDDFAPEHLLPLYQSGHANTGITIFERRTAA